MAKRISKRRKEMGEEAWAEHTKQRNRAKTQRYEARTLKSFYVAECRRNTKLKLIEYKGGKCEKCGYNKPIPGAYDFHHLDPTTKEYEISKGGETKSLASLITEVDKCILLCKNCHAEIHYEEWKIKRQKQVIILEYIPREKCEPKLCECGKRIDRRSKSCINCYNKSRKIK